MAHEWKWFGYWGHLCVADQCLFHLHTHVGAYCVSTVGDYWPLSPGRTQQETVGFDRFYETMVFRLDENGEEVYAGGELDMQGYNTPENANIGHMAMCHKWAGKEVDDG